MSTKDCTYLLLLHFSVQLKVKLTIFFLFQFSLAFFLLLDLSLLKIHFMLQKILIDLLLIFLTVFLLVLHVQLLKHLRRLLDLLVRVVLQRVQNVDQCQVLVHIVLEARLYVCGGVGELQPHLVHLVSAHGQVEFQEV